MHEYNPPCPGKTAPRILEDLLDYDARRSKTRQYHVLTDPAPQYIDDQKLVPVRKDERDCRHNLVIKEEQSTGPISADQKPDLSTKYVVATYCTLCRYHFHITVDYTRSNGIGKEPCSLGSNNPLHHFRYVQNKSEKGIPRNETPKYEGHIEFLHFKCSNTKCPAVTEIKITPPRFAKEFSKQFTDRAKLDARYRAALNSAAESDAPHRFDNDQVLRPSAAMYVMYQYLRDAINQKPGEKKRISTRNKKFMLACGEDCDEMLKYLDFERAQAEDEQVSIKTSSDEGSLYDHGFLQEFWNLPRIIPDDNQEQIYFLQDVMHELSQMVLDRTGVEDPDPRFSYSPKSAIKRIKKSFGCWDYPRNSREVDEVSNEHPHYASLGACGDFADDLIIYCYFKQKRCDGLNKPYYLDCLAGIAAGRESSELQVEVAKEDSSGELRLNTIRDAYKFFSIDPIDSNRDEGDAYILGVYRSRIESAPRQKDEARKCLRIIAKSRNSPELEAVANDKSMSAEEAYEFLGVTSETAADSIEAAAVAKSFDVDPSQVVKALRVIANTRDDSTLHTVATGLEPRDIDMLDVSQAYNTLQIEDQSMSDQNILMYYQSLMEKAMGQGSKDSYEKALKAIALYRTSDLLLAKLDNPEANVGPQLSTAEHPVGLQNIGNTCYLNSLLQFYYTVKPIRDIVMNFQEYRMEVDARDVTKRVGGQVVGRGEIIKAQRFVEELGTLYSELMTASTADVRPSQKLAELALLSTDLENTFRRSSISSPRTTFDTRNTSIMNSAPEAEMVVPLNFSSPPPPPPSRPSPLVPGSIDVVMTDGPLPNIPVDQGDTSSEATLVNSDQIQPQDINGEVDLPMQDTPNEIEGGNVHGVLAEPRHPTPDNIEAINGVEPSPRIAAMINGHGLPPPPPYEQDLGFDTQVPGLPPPIPPRNKPGPIDTASANDSSELGAQMVRFGAQQDVTEVIQNVMFRLSCAIKPMAKDTDNKNEQIDQIKNTFFGQSTIFLNKPEGWVSRQDDWNNLMVFPATNGTRSIYEALDVYFDPQIVEYENMKLRQYASIKKLPPILQILIQRTAFDKTTGASKNQNWIAADETIYLDRYLDSNPESSLMARRREAWAWKESLRELDARRAILEETCTALNVPEAISATAEALKALQEEDIDRFAIDPSLIDSLEVRADETARELAGINMQIGEVKKRLDDQFTDLRKHKYTLQAVFMHRGTSSYGHYWIYIYDFATHVWREYNDERVQIVEDTKKIFSPDTGAGNKATPYYLVYVNDEQKDQLVDAVCRDLHVSTLRNPNHVNLPALAEILDEGIDMGKDNDGTSMHIEHVQVAASRPTLERSAPDGLDLSS